MRIIITFNCAILFDILQPYTMICNWIVAIRQMLHTSIDSENTALLERSEALPRVCQEPN